jgi:hypothetical protein
LTAKADDGLAPLILSLQGYKAGSRMVDDPKNKASTGVSSGLVNAVKRHCYLTRPAQSPAHPQFATRDHGLVEDDLA